MGSVLSKVTKLETHKVRETARPVVANLVLYLLCYLKSYLKS